MMVVTILAVIVAVQYRKNKDLQNLKHQSTGNVQSGTLSAGTKAQEEKTVPNSNASPSVNSDVPVSDVQFQQWVREQAKEMESPVASGRDKEQALHQAVTKVTPSQAKQLRITVSQSQALPRERILSAYLLVEGGAATRSELKEAITAPLAEQGPHEVHSDEEVKAAREKSLRIMMIDGLFAQAKTDPEARGTLARVISDSVDPYIKTYAQEKFDQLPKN